MQGVKKASAGNPESFYEGERIENVTDAADCGDAPLLGGTAWLFARDQLDGELDYLFIDEAGQVSLADALAMGTAARNLVLVGDPLQLAQVLQGSHPEGAGRLRAHAPARRARDDPRRPRDLPRAHLPPPPRRLRLHLGGVLRGAAAARPVHRGAGDAARDRPALHPGRARGAHARSRRRRPRRSRRRSSALLAAGVAAADVMVVAPYNAQVNLLRERLPEAVRVGTVDKFQGQEAKVVLYSMASSSGEDVPRGLEFLLSRNRLNVAISRAQCLAYLVASPRLLEVNCRTIDQMRLANALCRFVELAA